MRITKTDAQIKSFRASVRASANWISNVSETEYAFIMTDLCQSPKQFKFAPCWHDQLIGYFTALAPLEDSGITEHRWRLNEKQSLRMLETSDRGR
jgi:hypothetical protein